MARSSSEILSPARAELARGRPRAALRELDKARAELRAAADVAGLGELRELAHGVRTLAPVDNKTREHLLDAVEHDIESLSPAAIARPIAAEEPVAPADTGARFVPYGGIPVEQILAPARAEIERGKSGRALRALEKARRKLLGRADFRGLHELIELAHRIPATAPRHEKKRARLIEAARQNVRYLSRRSALKAGDEWSDPFAVKPTTRAKLPSLPPMTRREIAISAVIVVAIVGILTGWALANRAPQRVAHAIKCPTGEEGSPTWSPDGKQIAFANNGECGTQIMVVSVSNGRVSTVTRRYGVLPDWSPDGQTILYRSSDGFSVVAAGGGEPLLLRSDDGDLGASWSPDNTRIAFAHGLAGDPDAGFDSTLYTMNSEGGDLRRLLGHSCDPRTPEWSPAGKRLFFACNDGIYYMPAKGGSAKKFIVDDFSIWPVSVSVARSTGQLAFGWVGVEIYPIKGRRDPKVLVRVENWRDSKIAVAWSPDGKQIAYSVTGSGSDDGLYVIDRDGSHRKLLVSF